MGEGDSKTALPRATSALNGGENQMVPSTNVLKREISAISSISTDGAITLTAAAAAAAAILVVKKPKKAVASPFGLSSSAGVISAAAVLVGLNSKRKSGEAHTKNKKQMASNASNTSDVPLGDLMKGAFELLSSIWTQKKQVATRTTRPWSEQKAREQFAKIGYTYSWRDPNGSCFLYASMPESQYGEEAERARQNRRWREDMRDHVFPDFDHYSVMVLNSVNEAREAGGLQLFDESEDGKRGAWEYWVEHVTDSGYWMTDFEISLMVSLGNVGLIAN